MFHQSNSLNRDSFVIEIDCFFDTNEDPSLSFTEFFDLISSRFREVRIFSVVSDELILVERKNKFDGLNGDDDFVVLTVDDYELSFQPF